MKIKQLSILILLLLTINGYSQNWQSLDGGANNGVISIYGDTTNNILYAAGYFTSIGGIPANRIAKWDGVNWDSLGSGVYGVNSAAWNAFTMYRGQIVFVGNTFSCPNQYISTWNGTQWDSIGSNFSDCCFKGAVTLNKELYAFGIFNSINGTPYNSIAKYDTIGNTWISVGFPYTTPTDAATINCLEIYNGELYAGGLFLDSTGVAKNIAKFNGSYWSIVGQGITGFSDQVFDLCVYQNELYAAGEFSFSSGNPGNKIARWNDTIWSDVGGGVTASSGQINSLLVLNNKLYAGGAYSEIGGLPAPHIASWDGTNWCVFGNSTFTSGTTCLAIINNDLFLNSGLVWDADTLNYIAQWVGGSYVDTCGFSSVGINEVVFNSELLNIYPNPSTNQITIEFDLEETKNVSIEIKNILGQTIKTISNNSFIIGKNKIEFDVSVFSRGLYFIQLQSDNKVISKKIIKE